MMVAEMKNDPFLLSFAARLARLLSTSPWRGRRGAGKFSFQSAHGQVG